LPTGPFFLRDQSLVVELLQGRINRAGARVPHVPTALFQLLHDLVAIVRLLPEERENRGANVTASSARASPEGVPPETTGIKTAAPAEAPGASAAAAAIGKKEREGIATASEM
jgi:hypothetical protein